MCVLSFKILIKLVNILSFFLCHIIIREKYVSVEANAVESRYSGVLEGWLEDAPDDDHHDVHTLELNHHVRFRAWTLVGDCMEFQHLNFNPVDLYIKI